MRDIEAFEAAPFPIAVHQDRRVVYANPACLELIAHLGYGPEDLPDVDVFSTTAPEEREAALANYRRIMEGDGSRAHAQTRLLRGKDGRRVPVVGSVVRTEWEGRPALWAGLLWACGPEGAALPTPNLPADSPPLPAPRRQEAVLARLSPRERQVAALAAEGYASVNIAAQLELGEHTVRDHLKSAYRKLGVHSRVELTRLLHGAE